MESPVDISIDEAVSRREAGAAWIDVRERDEWDEARIADTQLAPLSAGIEPIIEQHTDKAAVLVVSCKSGGRSRRVVEALRDMGYANAVNVEGGILAWHAAGRPVLSGADE